MEPAPLAALCVGAAVALLLLRVAMRVLRIASLVRQLTKQGVPGPKQRGLWGNAQDLTGKRAPQQVMHEWHQQYGPIIQTRMAIMPTVSVNDPVLARQILSGPTRLDKSARIYARLNQMTVPPKFNILTSMESNPHWKVMRKGLAPAFTIANVKRSFPAIMAITKQLVSGLIARGPDTPIDMDEAAQRLTADVIMRFGFDSDYGATDLTKRCAPLEVLQRFLTCTQMRTNPMNSWCPWRKEFWMLRQATIDMDAMVTELARDVIKSTPAEHTMAARLMECRDVNTGEPLSFDQLKSEIAIMWTAGFETTAHTISWTLFLLSTCPRAEAKVLAELDARGLLATATNPQPRDVSWDDLASMKYLNAAIDDSLRMFPVISSGSIRTTTQPTKLGPYTLPAGVMVLGHIYATHHSAANWPEPDTFLPERWLEGNEDVTSWSDANEKELLMQAAGTETAQSAAGQQGPKSRAFLPFSEGPRSCIGMSLALTEVRAVIATLMGRFSFDLTPDMGGYEGVCKSAVQKVTMKPVNGLWMYVRPRVNASVPAA